MSVWLIRSIEILSSDFSLADLLLSIRVAKQKKKKISFVYLLFTCDVKKRAISELKLEVNRAKFDRDGVLVIFFVLLIATMAKKNNTLWGVFLTK